MHIFTLAMLLSIAVTSPLAAQPDDENWEKCRDEQPSVSIAGCTAIINSGEQNDRGKAFFNRGVAFLNRNKYKNAISDFTQSLRVSPNDADSYLYRGKAYAREWHYKRAIRDYDAALRLNPKNAQAYYRRGYAYLFEYDYPRATQDIKEALQLDPTLGREDSDEADEAADQSEQAIPLPLPQTVDEAVLRLKTEWLSPDSRDWILRNPRDTVAAELQLEFGMNVRNNFGLWAGNRRLLDSCGTTRAEACSGIIIRRLWEAIRSDADPHLVGALDCQFKLADKIGINSTGFDKMTLGEMLDSIQQQIDKEMSRIATQTHKTCQPSLRLKIEGNPDFSCFVRVEFAPENATVPLQLLLGWISWRNAFAVEHDPPNIEFQFQKQCAWPKRPDYFHWK